MVDRWQQRAGFSVFFDVESPGRDRPGDPRRRTRLYHEETGDESVFPGWGPTDWVSWMLARLAGEPTPGADDTITVELRLRVSGIARRP
jgi:hypothetical protein